MLVVLGMVFLAVNLYLRHRASARLAGVPEGSAQPLGDMAKCPIECIGKFDRFFVPLSGKRSRRN
jgi:hypothetical protein